MKYEKKEVIYPSDVYDGDRSKRQFCTKEVVENRMENWRIVDFRPVQKGENYISFDFSGYVGTGPAIERNRHKPHFIVVPKSTQKIEDVWE